jgi:hypothetical protein
MFIPVREEELEAFQNEVCACCLSKGMPNGHDKQLRCLKWMECILARVADQGRARNPYHVILCFCSCE